MVSQPTGRRPRVFVSSTIRDFVDLRDALRYWLEEMGLEVQQSEHTDFERRPDAGTFEACFEAIRESDYYVLLIGYRRGEWYEEQNRTSVTRQEYRVAQESMRTSGRPIMLSFVRSDVLTILRERQQLGTPAGSSTLEDWEFTSDFVREVRKEGEARATEGESGDRTGGNWLASFRDFRELVTILRTTLRLANPLPLQALFESLRWECRHNLRLLLTKTTGRPFYSHHWLGRVRRSVILQAQHLDNIRGATSLSYEQLRDVVAQLITGLAQPEKFVQTVMTQAISSGSLLVYDRTAQAYVTTPLLEALYRLREELEVYRVRHLAVKEQQDEIFRIWESARAFQQGGSVPTLGLFGLYAVDDNLYNIERILVGILRYLYGHTKTVEVHYRPLSPIPTFHEELERETVTDEDLDGWLRDDDLLLRVGMTDATDEQRKQWEATEGIVRELVGDEKYEEIKRRVMEKLLGFSLDDPV